MRKAVFLDRDGVINQDHGYVVRIEDFDFIDGVFEACRHFIAKGYDLIVVTNQSGIGRGYYSEADFAKLSAWMSAQFKEQGAPLLDVLFCPHHPEKALPEYLADCQCRKPAPGMLIAAANKHNIDLSQSVMIGDKPSDISAGKAAGVARTVLVESQPNAKIIADDALPAGTERWQTLKDAPQRF